MGWDHCCANTEETTWYRSPKKTSSWNWCQRTCCYRDRGLSILKQCSAKSTPNWSSRMMHQGHAHPRSSSIISLPMINMNSGEPWRVSTPHSTMCMGWVCYNIPCPYRHNVRSTLVLEGIRDNVWVTSGSPTATEGHNRAVGQLTHHHESVRCNRNLNRSVWSWYSVRGNMRREWGGSRA